MNASEVAGRWELVIDTPIGRQDVVLEIDDGATGLGGVAVGAAESVPLLDLRLDGDHLRWRQSITRPLRLNLSFDVVVDGNAMSGASKAGRLPAARVTGVRTRAGVDRS